jgi:CRISPR system Cascade subunit CasE
MTQPLYLVRLHLDRRELARLERRPRSVDEGYLLHAGLTQLFATSEAPATSLVQPFALDDLWAKNRPSSELVPLLGYSSQDEGALLERMGPARERLLRHLEVRAVPEIAAGTICRFRTRVCPVVRTKQGGQRGQPLALNRRGKTVSREVDAWLAARFRDWQPEPPRDRQSPADTWADRERVYRDWLAAELARTTDRPGITAPPAELREAELTEFQRDTFQRKRQGAEGPSWKASERPDAVLEGMLQVRDAASFRALLGRGVGRHRAFGFGLLLVRPA